jgi:hypothetical protein
MDRRDPDKHPGSKARDDDDTGLLCPSCASEPARAIAILDTSKGKTVRLFRCQCGELIWDD